MAIAEEPLIDRIYEAGAVPELWPDLLDQVAGACGARGGLIISNTDGDARWAGSLCLCETRAAFIEDGWTAHNTRVTRSLAAPPHAGFRTDTDLHTREEIASMPMYVEFLTPRGFDAGAGTIVQGAGDDGLMITVEGFGDHDAARVAVPLLDSLRPHIARAAVLSARLQLDRARAAVLALDLIRIPAAMLDRRGRPLAMNAGFERLLDRDAFDTPAGLRLRDAAADGLLRDALAGIERGGRSIPLRRDASRTPAALHVIPILRTARDFFTDAAAICVVAEAANRSVPQADLLQLLFDLTPAEAEVARSIAAGQVSGAIARLRGTSVQTVRTQVKTIMAKTAAAGQADLRVLLTTLSSPAPAAG